MTSLKEIREILDYFYKKVSYQMRYPFSCTMKTSTDNVRRFIEPICDLLIGLIFPRSTVLGLTTAGNRPYTVLGLKR